MKVPSINMSSAMFARAAKRGAATDAREDYLAKTSSYFELSKSSNNMMPKTKEFLSKINSISDNDI